MLTHTTINYSHNDRYSYNNGIGIEPGTDYGIDPTIEPGNINIINNTPMKKKDFIEAVEAATNKSKLQQLAADNGIEVDLNGLNKNAAMAAILQVIEDDYSEFEDDDDLLDTEDENDDGNGDEGNEGDEGDEGNGNLNHTNRNKNKSVKTMAQLVKEIKADPNRDIDDIVRGVKYLNSLTEKEGEFGDYRLGQMTLDVPIDGYVPETDDNGITRFNPGDQDRVFFITSALINVLREDPELAGIYNKIREDESILYQVCAGTKFKFLVEYVSANQSWKNPFGRRGTARSYDHDWVAVIPYAVKELGADAQMFADLALLGDNVPASVVMALLKERKANIKKLRH